MKLLDTTFLIHYWAGREDVAAYLERHEESAEFVTTTINLKEIAVGRQLQGKYDEHEIRSTFDWVSIAPFTIEDAFVASQLEATLRRKDGLNRDKIHSLTADLLIAAVAVNRNASVVTHNTSDFELFDGVDVESY